MKTFIGTHTAIRLAFACAILASVTFVSASTCRAESSADKHARKVHSKLEKYSSGSYLHLVLRDHSNEYGALGALTDASFSFKDSDTNAVSKISYADVGQVRTDREPIGEGSEHHIRTRTLVVAGVLAAGAAVAAFEVR
jgi:hypothetical protein